MALFLVAAGATQGWLRAPMPKMCHAICTSSVGVMGVADDTNSSFMKGPASAPPLIRTAIRSDSANPYSERGTPVEYVELGDILMGCSQEQIQQSVIDALDRGLTLLTLGGDHAVSYPLIKAFAEWRVANRRADCARFQVLHFDAHTDTYDSLGGNRYSHACPFARVSELPDPPNVMQVGIRTLTPHHREQASKFGIRAIEARNFPRSNEELSAVLDDWIAPPSAEQPFAPLYISIDMDVLDPAFAPGVSHHEPGGLSTRDVLDTLAALPPRARIIGADCVEYNPTRDLNGVTAMVAAKLCKELIALLTEGKDA